MNFEIDSQSCSIALKEWAVTCHALSEGRQIALLRKGGILDEDGIFDLEHRVFWLQPTYLHQDEALTKPEHRDLFAQVEQSRAEGENRKFIAIRIFACVTDVFALGEADEERVRAAPHIWSNAYLDGRLAYNPEHPLLCMALRVYRMEEPYILPMQPQWTGCRSWIDLEQPLSLAGVHRVLDDAAFESARHKLATALAH